MNAVEENSVLMSSPMDDKDTSGDSAGERPVGGTDSEEPRSTPPAPDTDVGRLPLLLYAFIAVLLAAATVSLVA